MTFRAEKEKAAGESGVLLGPLQGSYPKALLHQAEEQTQLTMSFVVVYLFLWFGPTGSWRVTSQCPHFLETGLEVVSRPPPLSQALV